MERLGRKPCTYLGEQIVWPMVYMCKFSNRVWLSYRAPNFPCVVRFFLFLFLPHLLHFPTHTFPLAMLTSTFLLYSSVGGLCITGKRCINIPGERHTPDLTSHVLKNLSKVRLLHRKGEAAGIDQVAKYFYCVAQNFKLEWTMGAFGKVLTHELYFKSSNCEG